MSLKTFKLKNIIRLLQNIFWHPKSMVQLFRVRLMQARDRLQLNRCKGDSIRMLLMHSKLCYMLESLYPESMSEGLIIKPYY